LQAALAACHAGRSQLMRPTGRGSPPLRRAAEAAPSPVVELNRATRSAWPRVEAGLAIVDALSGHLARYHLLPRCAATCSFASAAPTRRAAN
jgi:predicted RNA polymerase sigma factor